MKKTSKIIMVLAVLIAGSMIAGAALVPYLSNKVGAEITVSSPMVAGISLGKPSWAGAHFPTADWDYSWDDSITISDVHGGETVTLYTMSKNVANAEITGFEEAIVTNWAGVTCDDFESVIVRVDSIYGNLGYGTPQELIGTGGCQIINAYNVQFGSPDNSTWGIGETDVTEIKVTFKTNAFGTYTFTYQIIP